MGTENPQPYYSDLIKNPNQRTPCVLVLDASGSMAMQAGNLTRIEALNNGLKIFEQELKKDATAKTRVQLAIVCVGGPAGDADVMMDWTDAKDFQVFELSAGGATPLGKGLSLALDLIQQGKQALKSHGVGHTRPWIMVITDGNPTDDASDWHRAAAACRAAEAASKCIIYPIGVQGVDVATLQQISTTPVMLLDQVKFVELFKWLSDSLQGASRSRPGDELQLASPNAWAAVKM